MCVCDQGAGGSPWKNVGLKSHRSRGGLLGILFKQLLCVCYRGAGGSPRKNVGLKSHPSRGGLLGILFKQLLCVCVTRGPEDPLERTWD